MTDEIDSFTAWVIRIFGSVKAYQKSLPNRLWFKLENGLWTSVPR